MKLVSCLMVAAGVVGGAIRCRGQEPPGPPTLENLLENSGTARPESRRPPQLSVEKKPQDRQQIPDAAAVEEARRLVGLAYEDDIKAGTKNPEKLVQKLLAAADTTEIPARQFAILLEAEEAAAKGDDHARVMDIIDMRAERFEIDRLQARLDRLGAMLTPTARKSPEILGRLYELALETAENGMEEDALPQAKTAADIAASLAKSMFLVGRSRKDSALVIDGEEKELTAKNLGKTIERRKVLLAEYRTAARVLEATPDDPRANAVAGKYLCYHCSKWSVGLPLLAKSEAGALRNAAAEELAVLAAESLDVARAFSMAGGWWALSESAGADPAEELAIRRHAGAIYGLLADRLVEPLDVQLARTRFAKSGATNADVRAVGGDLRATVDRVHERRAVAEGAVAGKPGSGGPQSSEDAVEQAINASLAWLVAHQLDDGGWSFDHGSNPACRGQCSHAASGRRAEDRAAATALAIICLSRNGHSPKQGKYKSQVRKAAAYLAGFVDQSGKCYGQSGNLYSQGCAAIALAEMYADTKDPRLKPAAQASLNFIQEAQDQRGGGWRYAPGQAGDTSATGWQVAALSAGRKAGLAVRPAVLANATRFLDSVQADAGAVYGYTDNASPTPARSAVGLFCRIELGWAANHVALRDGANRLAAKGPSGDLYFDYYSTCVLHHVQGDLWQPWRSKVEQLLLKTQATDNHASGSWYDGVESGHAATAAGRLCCTALATMTLTVR